MRDPAIPQMKFELNQDIALVQIGQKPVLSNSKKKAVSPRLTVQTQALRQFQHSVQNLPKQAYRNSTAQQSKLNKQLRTPRQKAKRKAMRSATAEQSEDFCDDKYEHPQTATLERKNPNRNNALFQSRQSNSNSMLLDLSPSHYKSRQMDEYSPTPTDKYSLIPIMQPKTTIVLNVSTHISKQGKRPQTSKLDQDQQQLQFNLANFGTSKGQSRYLSKFASSQQNFQPSTITNKNMNNRPQTREGVGKSVHYTNPDQVYSDNPGLYQHRFGDGSVVVDASINIGSPLRRSVNSRDASDEDLLRYSTKRLNTPFGCVLAQRSSLALKPRSAHQRQKHAQVTSFNSNKDTNGAAGPKNSQVKLRFSFEKLNQQSSATSLISKNKHALVVSESAIAPKKVETSMNTLPVTQASLNAPDVSPNRSLVLQNRRLLSQRPDSIHVSVPYKGHHLKTLAEMSPKEKKSFILKQAQSQSYSTLGSQEGYFKQSASLAALRSLHGSHFHDNLPTRIMITEKLRDPAFATLNHHETLSPMGPKMTDNQQQTMTERSCEGTPHRNPHECCCLYVLGKKNGSIPVKTQTRGISTQQLSKCASSSQNNRYSPTKNQYQQQNHSAGTKVEYVNIPTVNSEVESAQKAISLFQSKRESTPTERVAEMVRKVQDLSNNPTAGQSKRSTAKFGNVSGSFSYVSVKKASIESTQRQSPQNRMTYLSVQGDTKVIQSNPSSMSNIQLKNKHLNLSTRHNLSEARRKIAANSLSHDKIHMIEDDCGPNAFHVKVPTNIVVNETSEFEHGWSTTLIDRQTGSTHQSRVNTGNSPVGKRSRIDLKRLISAPNNKQSGIIEPQRHTTLTLVEHELPNLEAGSGRTSRNNRGERINSNEGTTLRIIESQRNQAKGMIETGELALSQEGIPIKQLEPAQEYRRVRRRNNSSAKVNKQHSTDQQVQFEKINMPEQRGYRSFNFIRNGKCKYNKEQTRANRKSRDRSKIQMQAIPMKTHKFGQDEPVFQHFKNEGTQSTLAHQSVSNRPRRKRLQSSKLHRNAQAFQPRDQLEPPMILTFKGSQPRDAGSMYASTAQLSMKDIVVSQQVCSRNKNSCQLSQDSGSKKQQKIDSILIAGPVINESIQQEMTKHFDVSLNLDTNIQAADQKQSEQALVNHDSIPIQDITAQGQKDTNEQRNVKMTEPELESQQQHQVALILADDKTIAMLQQNDVSILDGVQESTRRTNELSKRVAVQSKQTRKSSQNAHHPERPQNQRTKNRSSQIQMFRSILKQGQFQSAYKGTQD